MGSRWLKFLGGWVVLLGIAPVVRGAVAFFSVEGAQTVEFGTFVAMAKSSFMPDYMWGLRALGSWLAHPLPIADAQPFVDTMETLAEILNITLQLALVVLGVAIFRGKHWSRVGFIYIFGFAFVFGFLHEMVVLGRSVAVLGISEVGVDAARTFVAWVSPALLFLHPTVRTHWRG